MDNKKTLIGMAAVFLLCMGYWFFLVHYVYPKHPEWDVAGTLNQPAQTQPSDTNASTQPGNAMAATSTSPSMGSAPGSMLQVATTQPSGGPKIVGSIRPKDPDYGLGLKINPHGAGLDSVTINSYK